LAKVKSYLTDRRILVLIAIFIALAAFDGYTQFYKGGLHFGIEFVGGTQIPITLEHGVNQTEMSSIISILDQRVSTFGLREVTVEGIGNNTIYVTIPSASSEGINQTINILESQGNFVGVVAGREAINGTGILKGSIGEVQPQLINNTVTWTVTFFITDAAAKMFSKAVFGEGNQPLYMFLDRPSSTIVLLNGSELGNSSLGISASQALNELQSAMQLGNRTIPVIAVYNTNYSISSAETYLNSEKGVYRKVIAESNLNRSLMQAAKVDNYTLVLEDKENITPIFTTTQNGTLVDTWQSVGLLSSPILNPSLANGSTGSSYEISGIAPTKLPKSQQLVYATTQTKSIASILSGGALPVSIIVGTPGPIPPTLAKHFFETSGVILIVAVVAISIFIVIRYRRIFLIVPILLTTLMELFIIGSIIGLVGTIDLSAVAGMIAVVGTGVDAQIIITDEVLARRGGQASAKTLLGNAFYIVWADALLLIIAMLPLFFSTSLVDVIGFSESTIIGALLGVLITRPAYGAIIAKHYD
jgi:preprotein translocase subunit SecD